MNYRSIINRITLRSALLAVFILCGGISAPGVSQGMEIVSLKRENPLLDMVGKPYFRYHDTYMEVMSGLLHGDSLSRTELIRLFGEAADADGSGEWGLLADMIKNIVRFYESRDGGYTWSSDFTAEEYSGNMLALASRAGDQGFPLLRIFGLYQAAEGYAVFSQDYEKAFTYYLEAASALENVTTDEFPPRPHIYNEIAALYYMFGEYGDAIIYYCKVVEDPGVDDNYYHSVYPAMNGLGISYRKGYADYDRSDSCFTRILEQVRSNEPDRDILGGYC